jgi:glycosyltransferase involved in cell wall biosynthesis
MKDDCEPLRIAMISTPFISVPPRDYGGTELVVYELVEGLIDQGHEVVLFTTGDACSRAKCVSLYPEPCWPPQPLSELNHASWAMSHIAQGGFDLIHAHCAHALALSRLTPNIPLVYTVHHDRTADLSEFYQFFRDAHYIAISGRQKELEVPLESCDVIHHGLNPARFEWVETPGDYVCFVGRFAKEKGPHTAMEAARQAGVPIYMAGDVHPGTERFAEQEVLPRLKQPHVCYLGKIGLSRKVPLLRDARALLAPIEWNEPFGLILIEAMLSGCPVIAFPRGSAPEIVEPGVTGFLVKSREEMAEVIRPGGVLDDFDRGHCRERAVERFSRARLVADHVKLYQRVIAAKARPRKLEAERYLTEALNRA